MTYQEYIELKPEHFVYKGQSEGELKALLHACFGYDCSCICEDDKYSPVKPPAGTIFVGDDVNNGWISDKIAFYGWNIQFVKGFCSNEIKFK